MTDVDPWLGEPFDDDVPWADPNIRKDYEAALGRFILLFNELDYHVGSFIRAELERSGQSQLSDSGASFAQRLPLFGVLARADTYLSQVSVADLRVSKWASQSSSARTLRPESLRWIIQASSSTEVPGLPRS